MQEQYWVIAQMAIDMCMLLLLVVLLRSGRRKGRKAVASDRVFLHSEQLLNEMKQISLTLEKNLEEKRAISQRITADLGTLLSDAEEAALRLEGLMNTWKKSRPGESNQPSDTARLKKSARILFEKGLAKKDIARRLDVPLGELNLMLKLQTPAFNKK